MIEVEFKNGGVLIADHVGLGKVYAPSEYPKSSKTNKIQSDRILLAGTCNYCHRA